MKSIELSYQWTKLLQHSIYAVIRYFFLLYQFKTRHFLGYVEFRFDLGSGKVKLNSTQPVPNGKKVKIVAKRYHRDGTLTVDGQPDVTGSSGGDLKSLDLAEHLFVGSIPNISPKISENIGFVDGFIGCIHKLQIGNQKIDLSSPQSKDVIKIHNVQDCKLAPCTINRCLNGGTCHPGTSFTSFVCSCPKYYTGSYCQIKSEVCARANPCIKGTTCTLLPLGGFSCQCNNGKSEKLCIESRLFKQVSCSKYFFSILFSSSGSWQFNYSFYRIFISRTTDRAKYCSGFCD